VRAVLRAEELSQPQVGLSQLLYDAVLRLEQHYQVYPDILVILSIHSPLRSAEYIQQAVDTLVLFNVDTVISVYEDRELLFTHGEYGLEPLNKGMLQRLVLEREALFAHNGAIEAAWRDVVTPETYFGKKIGHVVMPASESYQIKSPFERWLVEQLLERRQARTAVL
jgi:CMP-N-acetylneuraminic acid synthetase